MITKIEIDGFKTFRNFSLEFAPFTVIAGTNASGKSNLFDALNLLSRLAEVDVRTAFSEQRGEPIELFTHYGLEDIAEEMSFGVEMLVDRTIRDNWGGEEKLLYTRWRYEVKIRREANSLRIAHEYLGTINQQSDSWLGDHIPKNRIQDWCPSASLEQENRVYIDSDSDSIFLSQDGNGDGKKLNVNSISQTVLSSANSVDFAHVLAGKEEIRSWRFLQLNPQELRKPSLHYESANLASSGAHLAATLFRISQEDPYALKQISRKLNSIIQNLTDVSILNDKIGKQYVVQVKSSDQREFSSRVLSDGTLRMLVLCMLLFDPNSQGLICFEEPENGVHPFGIQHIVEMLRDLSADFEDPDSALNQIIITTHSPVLLGEIKKLADEKGLLIWFSQLVTNVLPSDKEKKVAFQITKMLQVSLLPSFSNNAASTTEKKIAMATVLKYLRSLPTEHSWLEAV